MNLFHYFRGPGGAVVSGWGDSSYASRQTESDWTEQLNRVLSEIDPDEMEPIHAWKLSARPAEPFQIKNMTYDVATEVPIYAVVRFDHTRARVIFTPTGAALTSPLPMEEAMAAQKRISKMMGKIKVSA